MARILIACEFSGIVRDAFIARGHDAVSCDLLATERESVARCAGVSYHSPAYHIKGDVLDHLNDGWDGMICFPDCTYLCVSGIHWNNRGRGWEKTDQAVEFVRTLLDAPIERIALENPVGVISSRIRKPDQIIQPYNFGEDASKKTCLWLKGLPPLSPTLYIEPRIVQWKGKEVKRWANQCDSNQNKLGPNENRWKDRARTYQGIADAMADQWGKVFV